MELSTIIGFVICVGFVGAAMVADIKMFWDFPSILITVGGTIGAMIMRYPFRMITSFVPIMMKSIFVKVDDPEEIIRKVMSLSVEAKRNGILGLEKVKIDNPFLRKGIQLAIDGVEPELIEAVLTIDIASTTERHDTCRGMLLAAGDIAPSFGMIGTLLGLVVMLGNMDDPKSIGPSMSVAIITTLYGAFIAHIFCLPVADKLAYFHKQEMVIKNLIVSGVLSIANGDHPAVVQEKLCSFLKPDLRKLVEVSVKNQNFSK